MTVDPGLFAGIEGGDELMREELAASRTSAGDAGAEEPGGATGDGVARHGSAPLPASRPPRASTKDADAPNSPAPRGGSGGQRGARPRTLFVDADACPVTREALAEARRAHVPVVIAGNTTQNLERHIGPHDPRSTADARGGFWVDVLVASVGADSADFAIVERLRPGDVVVTQDIGLAGICLGRGAQAIGVRGRPYDPLTIDSMLFVRHEEKRARRQGLRTRGPAPFTDEDRRRFSRNLRAMLSSPEPRR